MKLARSSDDHLSGPSGGDALSKAEAAVALSPVPPPATRAEASALRLMDGIDTGFSRAALDRFIELTPRGSVDKAPIAGLGVVSGVDQLLDSLALQDLKNDPGFQSLAPETQAKMLAAAEARPRPLAKQFQDLASDLSFRAMQHGVQALAAEQIGKHPGDDVAWKTFYRLLHTSGFENLRSDEQQKMLRLVGGTNDYVGDPSRKALATMMSSEAYIKAPSSHKERMMREFLEKQTASVSGTNGVVVASVRQPVSFSAAKDIGEFGFRSGKAEAVTHDVKVGDVTVKVTMPKNAGAHIHTIDEVSASLAALPRASLLAIKNVVVEPNQNPADAQWAVDYMDPDFQSYMTAGAEGVVSIYPVENKAQSRALTAAAGSEQHAWWKPSQISMDQSMIHETGHVLSLQKWGSDLNDPRWNDWKDAIKSDGIFPSRYAQKSTAEDFAEALVIYMNVKGTREESEMRAIMPERFKLIDQLLSSR